MEYSEAQLSDYLLKYYDIKGQIKPLDGEEDYNFLVKCDQRKLTLKISRKGAKKENIAFQTAILNHLKSTSFEYDFPEVVSSKTTDDFVELEAGIFMRVQTWVEGRTLGDVNPISGNLCFQWGQMAGALSQVLQGFDHPSAHRFYKWNPSESLWSKKYLEHISNVNQRGTALYFWDYFENEIKNKLRVLRKSVNYNDAHESNLLVDQDLYQPSICGVIDFGDAIYTETINELAIACAYAGMGKLEPMQAWVQVIKGYHKKFPLTASELEVLYGLIAARLLITVSNAAFNQINEPDNAYLQISAQPAWDLLAQMREIPAKLAQYHFRNACGMEACTQAEFFNNWLQAKPAFCEVIDIKNRKTHQIDFGIGSLDLGNNQNFENALNFSKRLKYVLEHHEADMAYGGYGEIRPFYSTAAFTEMGEQGAKWRTLHLGLDIWDDEGTPVYAPLDGVVHSYTDNVGKSNYGPTIILEHRVSEELIFYTLYGHLNRSSLDEMFVGKKIKAGSCFCHLGNDVENGNWASHLHFQIILDMFDNEGDYPGLAFANEANVWKSICPDPSTILHWAKASIANSSFEEINKKRARHLGRNLSVSYEQPLVIERAYGQYLYDQTGRRYLDMVNNVAHVGHQHPKVIEAASRQIAVLNTNTRYLHSNITDYAEELLSTFPDPLSVVFFVNSGSEANELALRMTECWTGSKEMIVLESGYHGSTGRNVEISSYKFDGKGGKGAPAQTHVVSKPDIYRGLHRDPELAGEAYSKEIERAIEKLTKENKQLGGFICEGILSCAGQVPLPVGYLKKAYAYVRSIGGLCISDEVQVGFGRIGKKFWGFELQDVVPDMVTLGKPIGNGHPLAAVVTTRKIADCFANGMEYFSTFGGNPVSCAIGLSVLQIIKEERLQENAEKLGAYLKMKLIELKETYSIIGDVRGEGFFLGIELVRDKQSLEPADKEANYLVNRLKDHAILLSTDGPLHNVIKIKPPMCFDKENADYMLKCLQKVLEEDAMNIDKLNHSNQNLN